jgi:uncharacterized membrane protein (Fun14 family)
MSETSPLQDKPAADEVAPARTKRPIWQSPSVWVAAVLMMLGLGLWGVEAITGGEEEGTTPSGFDGTTSLLESRSQTGEETDSDGLAPMSPAVFRLGAGYLGGFFLGWSLRKFIKLTLLVAGGLVVMLAAFQGLGWFEVNWPAVEEHLQLSLSWLQGQASTFKTFITGYLPSAGAGTAGLVVGFRRK